MLSTIAWRSIVEEGLADADILEELGLRRVEVVEVVPEAAGREGLDLQARGVADLLDLGEGINSTRSTSPALRAWTSAAESGTMRTVNSSMAGGSAQY